MAYMNDAARNRQTLLLKLAGIAMLFALITFLYAAHAGEEQTSVHQPATKTSEIHTVSDSNSNNQTKPMSNADLKNKLTPEQYRVTRENGTEPPFQNAYWNNHAEGIYVDLVSGEVLFSSTDKFDSGT